MASKLEKNYLNWKEKSIKEDKFIIMYPMSKNFCINQSETMKFTLIFQLKQKEKNIAIEIFASIVYTILIVVLSYFDVLNLDINYNNFS